MTADLSRRIYGSLCLCAGLLIIPAYDSWPVLGALLTPCALIIGAWLITRATLAIGLTTALLAALATDFTGTWVTAAAYPLLALAAAGVCAVILIERFRQRVAATRSARWTGRRDTESQE